jgi:adhesin transport system outer membrane protein
MCRFTVSFLAVITAIAAQPHVSHAASLDQELRGLVEEHPLIKANESQVIAAEKGVDASLAPFLPSFDITSGVGYERVSTPSFRASPDGVFKTDAENYAATLRENIFDGGKKFANRTGAKLQRDVANVTLTNVRQSTVFEGATAYINVLRQSELVMLSGQNGDNIRRQLNLEDERVRRGSGVAVDVLQAKSRLQLSLERLTATRGGLEDAKSRYLQVFGHMPDTAGMVLPLPVDPVLPANVEEAVHVALSENPAVIASGKRIDIGVQQKRAIDSEYYPNIDLVLQNKYEQDYIGSPGLRRDNTAKVQATWTLFSGLSTKSRAAQTAADTEARRSDYVQARRKAEEQTRLAWQALQTANERVVLLDNAVNIASEVFESRKKLRESGKETVINVLDAENEVFSARINYTSALYDARIAAYSVLLAIGRLELEKLAEAPKP